MRRVLAACIAAAALALAAAPVGTPGTPVRPPGELWSRFPLEPTTTSPPPAAPAPQRHPAPALPRSALPRTEPGGVQDFDSPLVLAALTVAITLLALASGPRTLMPHPRLTAAVADRRLEIALAGATVLLGVTIAYVLTVT